MPTFASDSVKGHRPSRRVSSDSIDIVKFDYITLTTQLKRPGLREASGGRPRRTIGCDDLGRSPGENDVATERYSHDNRFLNSFWNILWWVRSSIADVWRSSAPITDESDKAEEPAPLNCDEQPTMPIPEPADSMPSASDSNEAKYPKNEKIVELHRHKRLSLMEEYRTVEMREDLCEKIEMREELCEVLCNVVPWIGKELDSEIDRDGKERFYVEKAAERGERPVRPK